MATAGQKRATARGDAGSGRTGGPTRRRDAVARRVLWLAIAAAFALALAGPATIASVSVPDESCEALNDARPEVADRCALSGFERHGPALVLLALVAAGAGIAASRELAAPAPALALVAVGVAAVGIALIGDLPLTNETGAIGLDFETAEARAGLGFYLELAGGVLALLAGALALARNGARPAEA